LANCSASEVRPAFFSALSMAWVEYLSLRGPLELSAYFHMLSSSPGIVPVSVG
jgi:hypothetical protein